MNDQQQNGTPINKVIFQTNILERVALGFDGPGLEVKSSKPGYSDQVLYTLADGRRMYIAPIAAEYITKLGVRKGEEFLVGKVEEKSGQRRRVVWKVERIPAPEPETALARNLKNSIPVAHAIKAGDRRSSIEIAKDLERKKVVKEAPPIEWPETTPQQPPAKMIAAAASPGASSMPRMNGSGTQNSNTPPTKIPYDVAFREILHLVVEGLRAEGEQWTDAAKQDLVSTWLIDASRSGFLACWIRPEKKAS